MFFKALPPKNFKPKPVYHYVASNERPVNSVSSILDRAKDRMEKTNLLEKKVFIKSLDAWLDEVVEDKVAEILWLAFSGTVRVTCVMLYNKVRKLMWELNPRLVYRIAHIPEHINVGLRFDHVR